MRIHLLLLILFSTCCLTCNSDLLNLSGDAKELTCKDFENDIILEHKDGRSVDYIIDCLVEVDDIDITFYENVVVEFTEGSGLIIRGDAVLSIVSLVEEEPITLRGVKRESGYWKGIHLASNHDISRIVNGIISDAGDPTDARFKGAITFNTHGWITNSKISNVSGYGIYVDDYAKIRDGLVNLEINDCSNYPVSVPVPEWDEFYVVTPPKADLYGNLSISNCRPNKIEVRGSNIEALQQINGDIIGLPYPYVLEGDIVVPLSNRLKFLPGALMEMKEKSRIYVYGSFTTSGVSGNPAIIYGAEDRPGFWGGIYIDRPTAQTANRIEYLHILNGGNGPFENANITLRSGKYIVENCRISKSSSCGLRYFKSTTMLTETNNIYADNAGGGLCEN
jgi:hypothetical protein